MNLKFYLKIFTHQNDFYINIKKFKLGKYSYGSYYFIGK